jgi:hypothetical protein
MKQAYLLERNADTIEGRGPMRFVGVFSDRDSASVISNSEVCGWDMGGNPCGQITPITIYESVKEFREEATREIRAQALKKLNDAEKKALGLDK